MLKNYLKIALRTLQRHKGYTLINVAGLAVGMAACILIGLYVLDDLSYDRFHEKADRLVVLGQSFSFGGNVDRLISTPYPLAGALEREAPGVERAVRTLYPRTERVSRDGKAFADEAGVFHAEDGFFEVFSFPMRQGQAALAEPNTAVLSEQLARKYFPGESPVGQTLHVRASGEHTYRITGVARSQRNSYLDFGAVLSFPTLDYAESHADQWGSSMFNTFVLLKKGTTEEAFANQMQHVAAQHLQGNNSFFTVPLPALHLSGLIPVEGFRGQWGYVYLFGAVALFILLIACINYVNLATARAVRRAREVGVRKTVGATRGQVARQFLGESALLCVGAFLLALGLARAALPLFNALFGTEMAFADAGLPWFLLLGAAALAVGLLAGSYPALYLAGFNPTAALQAHSAHGPSDHALRQGLVVLQFTVAVVLLAATAVVYQQLRYMQKKDLGFSGEQVVLMEVPGEAGDAFRQEVLAQPGVRGVTVANGVPGRFYLGLARAPSDISSEARANAETSISVKPAVVDYDFVETLGLTLAAGRSFSRVRPSDQQSAYLINEVMAERLGWTPEEAVGKSFGLAGGGEIIGVVKNFHIASLHEKIEPVVLSLHEFENVSASSVLAAQLAPGALPQAIDRLKAQWARFSDEPFAYHFLDDEFAEAYRADQRLGQIFGAFAVIAVLIACLGLFGLAAFAAEARTKEIGIRKVLGASVGSIVALLSKDFLKLVLIAFVLAAPVAWLAMRRWLEDFAYRIDLSPGVFLLSGAAALGIALLTVSYQALKAARTNPTEALRSE